MVLFKLRAIVAVAFGLALAWPAAAVAKGEGERVGENLGDLLGWSKSLYVGIAAVVALVFLLNRRFADLAIFFVAAVAVGGFVMAPGEIAIWPGRWSQEAGPWQRHCPLVPGAAGTCPAVRPRGR